MIDWETFKYTTKDDRFSYFILKARTIVFGDYDNEMIKPNAVDDYFKWLRGNNDTIKEI